MAMTVNTTCFQCRREGHSDCELNLVLATQNSALYRFKCKRGHDTALFLQEHLFQLLFDLGLHAILDGYHREAVADFAASLERFYQFYFEFSCRVKGIDPAESSKAWSLVAAQSERQLGLFVASYLTMEGRSPMTLPGKLANFRNGVIHRGDIPNRTSAEDFGEAVRKVIQPVITGLDKKFPAQMMDMNVALLVAVNEALETVDTLARPTTLTFGTEQAGSLPEALNRVNSWKRTRAI
jgi:hypothetical protein